jgi:hypothetical protein
MQADCATGTGTSTSELTRRAVARPENFDPDDGGIEKRMPMVAHRSAGSIAITAYVGYPERPGSAAHGFGGTCYV